jgi:hypothetical protein
MMEEPLQRVQREVLDGADRERARMFTAGLAAHAVRDDEEVTSVVAVLGARLGQARLLHVHRLRQHGNEELILVLLADAPPVGQPEGSHGESGSVCHGDTSALQDPSRARGGLLVAATGLEQLFDRRLSCQAVG